MINGLGVFGWGVGGIEAEAAMLGQPLSMLIPAVVGFKLHGTLARRRHRHRPRSHRHRNAAQERRRRKIRRVLRHRPLEPQRFPTAPPSPTWRPNMAPRWASSPSTRKRSPISASPAAPHEQIASRRSLLQGTRPLPHRPDSRSRFSSDTLELDLATVVPTMAGPKRPQDRVPLTQRKNVLRKVARQAPRRNTSA